MVFALVQSIVDGLAAVMQSLLLILPVSPFSEVSLNIARKYLGYINFFLPISEICELMGVWLVAVGVFYIYMVVGRWVKVID